MAGTATKFRSCNRLGILAEIAGPFESSLPCRARRHNVPRMEGLSQETLAVIGAAIALAGPILRQGSRIDKRFDPIDRRFDPIDKRFDPIDGRMERIRERLTSMDKETTRIGGLVEGRGPSGVALPGSLA